MSVNVFLFIPVPEEKPDDLVGVNYVAARFGCSESAVYARKSGTDKLTIITESPRRYRREDVDSAVLQLIELKKSKSQSENSSSRKKLLKRKARQPVSREAGARA
jgi:hypothetical protein